MRQRADDPVKRWAEYFKAHPGKEWWKTAGPFWDSQIGIANRFYERLAKMRGGREKVQRLRELRWKRGGRRGT